LYPSFNVEMIDSIIPDSQSGYSP